jgi:hypothetical protein
MLSFKRGARHAGRKKEKAKGKKEKRDMNRLQIFKTLRKHRKLAEKRALNPNQKAIAKVMMWIAGAFTILYLMGIAIMFSLVINDSSRTTSLEFITTILPFLLTIDFFLRFSIQQTPSQIIKPYVLTRIPRKTCIDSFIATTLFSAGNIVWFALFIPYCLMSVVFNFGLWPTVILLLLLWVTIMANSQWYLIARTLINDSVRWWVLPAVVFAAMYTPWIIKNFDAFDKFYSTSGTIIETGNPLPLIIAIALLCILIAINRKIQLSHVMRELARVETSKAAGTKLLSRIAPWLDNKGATGRYIMLEIKSMMRNKNPRKAFIFSVVIILILSLLISFTDIYDGNFMTNFWAIYNYAIFGAMILSKIMCYEGNYIDGLLVHKENILSLLKAKYIIFSALLIPTFLLMLPTVFAGKWSLLMLIAYGLFTAGFQYFMLFQLAVYNNQTVPLNAKFIGKSGMENNYEQLIINLAAFFLPIIFISILQAFMSKTASYIVMLVIGLIFVLTYNMWMRNIYNRMMKRKYKNLEVMRATR